MPPVDATTSLRLLTAGPIPGWLGVLLLIAGLTLVLLPLRQEFKHGKSTRLTRIILPALRITIVTLLVWLLCQPVLILIKRWTPAPEVMLIVDSGNSMRVNESSGNLSQQLDALEAVGAQPIAKRNSAGSHIARASDALSRASVNAFAALQTDLDAVATGLPLGPSVTHTLETLASDLRRHADALATARTQLPTDSAEKEFKQSLTELLAASQVLGSSVDSLVADAAVVGREASKTPRLLDAFRTRLQKLTADAESARKLASLVQEKLDKATLTEKEIEQVRAKSLTRQALAELAADQLAAPKVGGPSWERTRSAALETALDDAFKKSLASPLAGVVLISDGGSAPAATSDKSASPLTQLKLPVSTVLVGADGVEPADAGLVAIDVPRLALAGDPVNIRCLVKNLVTTTPSPKLIITLGKETVATRDLPVTKNGEEVMEFAWTPAAAGRVQLVFRIDSAQPDAYPGNESSAAVVDVITSKARALVVSDRLTSDFAAVSQSLAAMPAVEARTILAAPGISKFRTGSKADEFPATADDFKALSLLVLIGDVPEGVSNDVIATLKQAVDAGLRVWVQTSQSGAKSTNATTAPAGVNKSWNEALGIGSRAIVGPKTIMPLPTLWLDLYQLGKDRDESAARWNSLPPALGLNEIATPGIALLTPDVLKIVRRGNGSIVAVGIENFASLRDPTSSTSVNRMLAESLTLGLAPLTEPGVAAGIFPAQPMLDRTTYLVGDATPNAGLAVGNEAPMDGLKPMSVSDAQSITVQIGGAPVTRIVRRLTSGQDFQLAAHAAPLEKIANDTGGRSRVLLTASEVMPEGLKGTPRSSTTRVPLWPGPWSLVVLLALVSTEYLLRRRAGRVM